MLTHRRQIADFIRSGSGLRTATSRLLTGLGFAASLAPQVTGAARKGQRGSDNQQRKNDDPENGRDDREQRNRNESGSDRGNEKASTEARDSSDESGKSGKRARDENRSEEDERSGQGGSTSGKTRDESSRQNADSDASSRDRSSGNDDSSEAGGRRVREFEQQVEEPVEDTPAVTTVTPANPNVAIDDIPTTSIADLVVEANDDVIATVSTSGGFAFARSGDVIAVTGPDGASIIQAGDVTSPPEPSDDGGNNDVDFSS